MTRFTTAMANPTKFHLAVLGMGCIGVAHFAISLFAWALLLRIPGGIPPNYLLHHATPAVILFFSFSVSLYLAWRSRRCAVPILTASLLAAACSFWYDTAHGYYQIQMMGTDLVCRHSYATWFWYEE